MLITEATATTLLTVFCIGLIGVGVWAWHYTKKRWDNVVAYSGLIAVISAAMFLFCRFILGIPVLAAQ